MLTSKQLMRGKVKARPAFRLFNELSQLLISVINFYLTVVLSSSKLSTGLKQGPSSRVPH